MRKSVLLLLLLVALAGSAQGGWYQVEIIVFARTDPRAGATEYWPEDPGAPALVGAQPLLGGSGGDQAFRKLPRDELRLARVYGGLVASRGQYEPLLHLAWRQPVEHGRGALPVYLTTEPGSSVLPPRLEGTLKLGVNRYLHTELDLVLRSVKAPRASTAREGDASLAQRAGYRSYRLQERRRMRSGELHYVDHPLMGVLLLVRSYGLAEKPETSDAEPPDQESPSPASN